MSAVRATAGTGRPRASSAVAAAAPSNAPIAEGACAVACHAALGQECDYLRGADGLYRCRSCGRYALRSALRDAGIGDATAAATVVRWFSRAQSEVIAQTTVDEGIKLATAIHARCVVVLANGITVFDNRQAY